MSQFAEHADEFFCYEPFLFYEQMSSTFWPMRYLVLLFP